MDDRELLDHIAAKVVALASKRGFYTLLNQAVYLSKAVEYLIERNELDYKFLAYVSPLNWEHINYMDLIALIKEICRLIYLERKNNKWRKLYALG